MGAALAELQKATFSAPATTTTGLNYYNLEPVAKRLYNAYTPFRNKTPRTKGMGSAANWRSLSSIDTNRIPMGVPDGFRGAELAHTVTEFTAKYVKIGSESATTFLAQLVAEGFDDVRALQALAGLRATQIREEQYLLTGLGTYGLGTTPTVTAVTSTTAGSLSTSTTYHVRCVALSAEGLRLSIAPASLGGALATQLTMTEAGPRARTYTVNGGAAQVSADATGATGANTSLDCTVTAVPGAAAYAWFIGSTATNGTLAKITTINVANLGSVPTIYSVLPTGYAGDVGTNFGADHSRNSLVFDGVLSIAAASGSGATIQSLDGAVLTGDGAGGITEFDDLLYSMAVNYKVDVEDIWCNYEQVPGIAARIMSGGSGPQLFHIMVPEGAAQGTITGGVTVKAYNNKFALDPARGTVRINIHPDVPAGTIMFTSQALPPVSFPDANIPGIFQVEALEEYVQREWPLTTEQYESGVYVTEVLKNYASFAIGVIQNVKRG
jgi:hypothetical protein